MAVDSTVSIGGDLRVCRLGFGAMRLTGPGIWGQPADREGARAVLRAAVRLGVDFIDTADSYGPLVSEELIAEALRPYPPDVVLATKGGFRRSGPGRWQPDGRPEHLRRACEGSLRRLGVDRIDLYQLHTVDRRTPFEESVGALADLRREGKVRHIGLSNVSIDELERARTIVPVVSVQNRYNVVDRGAEDVLRYCDRQGIAFICWLPLARGTLGRHAGRLRDMAIAYGATPSQLVLAWLLQRSPRAVPIPGTSSVAHLEENVGALDLQLSAEDVRALDEFRLDRVTLLLGAARKGRRRTLARLRRLQPPRGR